MRRALFGTGVFAFALLTSAPANAIPLSEHLKSLTSAFASRNVDSIRPFIDPNKVFVEISPKDGAYLSPEQTLSVIESFFHDHSPVSFSYILVREEGISGIAAGNFVSSDNGRIYTHRVNFGFQKNKSGLWLLNRITIR